MDKKKTVEIFFLGKNFLYIVIVPKCQSSVASLLKFKNKISVKVSLDHLVLKHKLFKGNNKKIKTYLIFELFVFFLGLIEIEMCNIPFVGA